MMNLGFILSPITDGKQGSLLSIDRVFYFSHELVHVTTGSLVLFTIQHNNIISVQPVQSSEDIIRAALKTPRFTGKIENQLIEKHILLPVLKLCKKDSGAVFVAKTLCSELDERGLSQLLEDSDLQETLHQIFLDQDLATDEDPRIRRFQHRIFNLELQQPLPNLLSVFALAITNGISLHSVQKDLHLWLEKNEDRLPDRIVDFLSKIGSVGYSKIYPKKKLPIPFLALLCEALHGDLVSFLHEEEQSDEMLLLKSLSDQSLLAQIHDWTYALDWLQQQRPQLLLLFLKRLPQQLIPAFKKDKIREALKHETNTEELLRLLHVLDHDFACSIAAEHFPHIPLLPDIFSSLQKRMQALALDMECKDGKIQEAAIYGGEEVHIYRGIDLKQHLLPELKKAKIIIGHNCRLWEMRMLNDLGLDLPSDVLVWDTLEMQALICPEQKIFSLITSHTAAQDSKRAMQLFWHQVFRISQDNQLYDLVADILPLSFSPVFALFRSAKCKAYIQSVLDKDKPFFHSLRQLSGEEKARLSEIPPTGSLLVSSQDKWASIAELQATYFPCTDKPDFLWIQRSLLRQRPLSHALAQAILLRFTEHSPSPIPQGLATYLRLPEKENGIRAFSVTLKNHFYGSHTVNKICFSDEILKSYLSSKAKQNAIPCISIDEIEKEKARNSTYQSIYLIGTRDWVDTQPLEYSASFAELTKKGSILPLTLHQQRLALVSEEEARLLALPEKEGTETIWASRATDGTYLFFKSSPLEAVHQKLATTFPSAEIKTIEWHCTQEREDLIPPLLVYTKRKKPGNFQPEQLRHSATTRYRSHHWVCQIKFLTALAEKHRRLHIIYIIEDERELPELTAFVRSHGFFIPEQGTLFRKLEYITAVPNGMLILSRKDFLENIANYKMERPFCYVWDEMRLDFCKIIWSSIRKEQTSSPEQNQSYDPSDRECIERSWESYLDIWTPIFANHPDSRCYILEPALDDNPDLPEVLHTEPCELSLFESQEEFDAALKDALSFFKRPSSKEFPFSFQEAEYFISKIFLNGAPLREQQKPLLKFILDKAGDVIITLPTGAGKSVLYQGSALLRACVSSRLSIVVQPLNALIADQVDSLHRKGFLANVAYLNSSITSTERQQIYRDLRSGVISLLFVTPERFKTRNFIEALEARYRLDGNKGEYVCFDEAHCISSWGQDFRPFYREALFYLCQLKQRVELTFLFFSATVTKQVEEDLMSFLVLQRMGTSSNPVRQHIGITCTKVEHSFDARVAKIISILNEQNLSPQRSKIIIFCPQRKQCEDLAESLENYALSEKARGTPMEQYQHRIDYYHARLDVDSKYERQEAFKEKDNLSVLCATKAFGMGMDIDNIHLVIHLAPPAELEDYLQEVGRAGRNQDAYEAAFPSGSLIPAICLYSEEDFRQAKDKLLQSRLGWGDLATLLKRINELIKTFSSLKESRWESDEQGNPTAGCKKPVIVPYNIWLKDPRKPSDIASTILGLYWLSRMGILHLGYINIGYLTLSFTTNLSTSDIDKETARLLKALKYYERRGTAKFLVPVNELKQHLHWTLASIMNHILIALEHEKITIHNTIQCTVSEKRLGEAEFMIKNDKNLFTLRLAFSALTQILGHYCRQKEECIVDAELLQTLCQEILSETDEYELQALNGDLFMPWYNPAQTSRPLSKWSQFKRDVERRTLPNLFVLLQGLLSSDIVQYSKEVKSKTQVQHRLTVGNDYWKSLLKSYEEDAFLLLKYIIANPQENYSWANILQDLDLSLKGYTYFEKLFFILNQLGYIESSPLILPGIEVYSTEFTELDILGNWTVPQQFQKYYQEFKDQEASKKARYAAMETFVCHVSSEHREEYIKLYFATKTFSDYVELIRQYVPQGSPILSQLLEEALNEEINRIKDNPEQMAIFSFREAKSINVIAGPGSGKTHMLILCCAHKLYKEHTNANAVFVVSYSRSVVEELRRRLKELFSKLGLARFGRDLNIFTFHGLALYVLDGQLNEGSDSDIQNQLNKLELRLYDLLQNEPQRFKRKFKDIKYIFIDEFQDITKIRLEILFTLKKLFPDILFFTIGDINQSIFGYDRINNLSIYTNEEYAKMLLPKPYYEKWDSIIHPVVFTLKTNYRSYQKILDLAGEYITNTNVELPVSDKNLMRHELHIQYAAIYDNRKISDSQMSSSSSHHKEWEQVLPKLIAWAQDQNQKQNHWNHIAEVAILFRTNTEIFKKLPIANQIINNINTNPNKKCDIRIRIQGANPCGMYRAREIFFILHTLESNPNKTLDKKALLAFKKEIMHHIKTNNYWNSFLLDIAYTLILDYYNEHASEGKISYADVAKSFRELAGKDNVDDVYKLYARHKGERILKSDCIYLVLTTYHKIKGLAFDAVILTPSEAPLPLRQHTGPHSLLAVEADLREEGNLMFVGATRARKLCLFFNGQREYDIHTFCKNIRTGKDWFNQYAESLKRRQYSRPQSSAYQEKADFSAYSLSFNAIYNEDSFEYIEKNLCLYSPVEIRQKKNSYLIFSYDKCVGALSSSSNVAQYMKREHLESLSGFVVSGIYALTLQETEYYDQKNGKTFAKRWNSKAIKRGYTYIVTIAGLPV